MKTRTQTDRRSRAQAVRQADLQTSVGRSLAPAIALTLAVLAIVGVGLVFSNRSSFAPAEQAQAPAVSVPQPPTRVPSSGQALGPGPIPSPSPATAPTGAQAQTNLTQPSNAAQPSSVPSPAAVAQAACQFATEFADFVRLVGRETIGECLVTERPSSAAGGAQQRTTRGLLVWLNAEKVAAFTNGGTTWYNCSSGVKQQAFHEPFPC